MEDRVKTILEKEHSKRFRAMCYRNDNLALQSKSLQEYYDRQKKKSLHSIETKEAELQQKIMTFSQDRFVNSLVNQLTEIAFSNSDLSADNLIKTVSSLSSVDTENPDVPRYLRMGTNPFQPSEMSLVSTSSNSVISPIEQETNSPGPEKADEIEESVKKFKTALSDDAVKRVVDKLTGFYDIDKLKFLTQVMLKTLQSNDRSRCEDKMKLIYSLNRYLNEGKPKPAQSPTRSKRESLPKVIGNDTFLFLKADRQQELRDEAVQEAKKLTIVTRAEKARTSFHERIHSMPTLFPAIKKSSMSSNIALSNPSSSNVPSLHDKTSDVIEETESTEFSDLMNIYLKLGHGTGVLKLPDQSNRAVTRNKQKFWLRKEMSKIPVVAKNGVQDLRVVMKNCRYLRFPKDMAQDMKY